ncbi:TetR/AcrR family transcriptional regulator [Alteromonas sp. ASW11-130]|uniref:TetR/AcrR family transcriptional regulator n=1 Tax=Alteromonas sp. ASW11-130 TaxID=3015775 RepID=UPI002241C005|nr:TetR/AcrR family transcriptional regulator [Alteromonas sp. ASW11-130]MCW8092933.1 TetR/AcrR family transcriptional regulator [Alteromonas sp. ASW11-130]
MPYSSEHKLKTRARIVESARIMFNRHGFVKVSIDDIMAEAGLTRGGFYNHFSSKEELYAEAISSFLLGVGKEWQNSANVAITNGGSAAVKAMISAYLSVEHLTEIDRQCPMIALPSDVGRARPEVKKAYQKLLETMTNLFSNNLPEKVKKPQETALAMSALCVGGMVLARTLDDKELSRKVTEASKYFAMNMANI